MEATASTKPDTADVREFTVDIPKEDLDDLRRRLQATRWPDKETVDDRSQGARLEELQGLVEYWGSDYDWRRFEAKLNELPQFKTEIDGLDIHFIHVRSPHEDAMPLIISHGWPGSVAELLKSISPLTDPTEHGGSAEDAFHLVLPSLPGYGFSDRPTSQGWDPDRIARAWAELMKRLGYERYVAQGGDWGSFITQWMGQQAPEGLLAIHINLPTPIPGEVGAALAGGPVPEMSDEERATFEMLAAGRKAGGSEYSVMLGQRPQTVGYGFADSPAALAAFHLLHLGFATWPYEGDERKTRDEVLDDITLYWLTNTGTSAARLYWEIHGLPFLVAPAIGTEKISVPIGVTLFGEDGFQPPRSWIERAYPTLDYFNKTERGGHFAAWEEPELFASEVRAAFNSQRNGG
jgi:pimeloyl-ACP methyl ester carboxylesterase